MPQNPMHSVHTEQVSYGLIDQEYVASLAALSTQDDGPFFMLNLMRYREWAEYPDDRPRISGRAADDLYAPLDVLHDLGAEVVLFGDVVAQVRGDEGWDRVAMVRYPTVRSFLDMQLRPDFIAQHVHKDAGMERTIISLCHPVAGSSAPGNRIVVDLMADADVEPLSGQLVFRVAGTPVGDGRGWSTLVITTVPDDAIGADQFSGDGVQATTVTVDALLKALP